MFDNVMLHVVSKPVLAVLFVVALLIVIFAVPYFLKQNKLYGSMFEFAAKSRKVWTGISAALLVGIGIYFFTPYVEPPSDEVAVVLGNTQNTPAPSIEGDVAKVVTATMLAHKGDDADTLVDSIKFISAVKQPKIISIDDSDIKLRKIGANKTNAERDAKNNIEAISEKLKAAKPSNGGANYLEAIIEARDNVKTGSRIIVIGSGLSDSGYLNFSKKSILTNEEVREEAVAEVQEKYGSNYLEGYTVEFYGLGDTTAPQEALSNIQKGIVRDIYQDSMRKLGAKVLVNTRTQVGQPVETQYSVGTTDTGCGDINLIYDDEDLKFVGDQAAFVDQAAATKALSAVYDIWAKQKDTIQAIQIDGYTAHYPGADSLSQERADAVKAALTGLGVTADKLTATGKGFGPYETDQQNRTVKINISRDNQQCSN